MRRKIFEKNGLKIDCDSRRVFVEDKEVKLTAKEYDLLELLSFHPNKVYSRENLLNIVWGYDYPGDVRTVDVHIRRLREKLKRIQVSLFIFIQSGGRILFPRLI